MTLTDFTEETDTPLTDRRQVKQRTKRADLELARRRATLAGVLNVKEGREFFWWLLEQFGPTRLPVAFAGAAVDVPHTMVNIGMANAGNLLLAEITAAAPDKYLLMLSEEQERQELRKNPNA